MMSPSPTSHLAPALTDMDSPKTLRAQYSTLAASRAQDERRVSSSALRLSGRRRSSSPSMLPFGVMAPPRLGGSEAMDSGTEPMLVREPLRSSLPGEVVRNVWEAASKWSFKLSRNTETDCVLIVARATFAKDEPIICTSCLSWLSRSCSNLLMAPPASDCSDLKTPSNWPANSFSGRSIETSDVLFLFAASSSAALSQICICTSNSCRKSAKASLRIFAMSCFTCATTEPASAMPCAEFASAGGASGRKATSVVTASQGSCS
mmetsp:Transcript_68523/g.172667  ORF Transcript_68523/g.172667 Transcript_68523/m.172667 type:complete len:263 (-) Transcript_68523:181-969(-)